MEQKKDTFWSDNSEDSLADIGNNQLFATRRKASDGKSPQHTEL